jgi:hypothetical protein
MIDDYFNEEWPEVSVGVARYCLSQNSLLRSFAISPNKIYFAKPGWHEKYQSRLKHSFSSERIRSQQMFGCEVVGFSDRRTVHTALMTPETLVRTALGYPREIIHQVVSNPNKVASAAVRALTSRWKA